MLHGTGIPTAKQRARALAWRQLGASAAIEDADKRQQLQRRVERRALEHQLMVDTTELEKIVEAKRCKLCDMLQAEAWGLGHANWQERRCGRCWVLQAEELARQRHSLPVTPAPPPRGGSHSTTAAPDNAAGAGMAGASAGSSLAALLSAVPADEVDDFITALRARDADRLLQLLGGAQQPQHEQGLAPDPERPREGYYYHDAVLGPLGEQQQEQQQEQQRRRELDDQQERQLCREDSAPSSPRSCCDQEDREDEEEQQQQSQQRQRRGEAGQRGDAANGGDDDEEDTASELSFGAPQALQQNPQQLRQQQELGPQNAPDEAQGTARMERRRPQSAAAAGAAGAAGAAAGHRRESRPLPSKPRALPTAEADMEAALREAERLVVFGATQRARSEALFYSHQLRAALADLRLLDRKARKAAAVHQYGMRLEPRDEQGVARIIREGRPERPPSPTTLRRINNPESLYVDPPRRAPRWLEHVHPDRPDPVKVVDAVAWRPPAGKAPPPKHTEGMQSAGDWGEYRYDWDLARIRSLPVEDYLTNKRKEREYRRAWAELQARTEVLGGSG